MGQTTSSASSKSGRQKSFRSFARRSKLNKSTYSHTFSLAPSEDIPELMNINMATEEQLMTLPGVNRQLAKTIVSHRQIIGRFKRVDDLALVSGIGAEKLEQLRQEICVNIKRPLSRTNSCSQTLENTKSSADKHSVNSSSIFQLQCIPGLNQELAANIVDHRNKKGPFKSLDDLIKVRGMDIVRLSTVKQHLSIEPQKCESLQHLNRDTSGWSIKSLSCTGNTTSTPKKHGRSMSSSARISLPNGFATAPVGDILELLAAYSHRPVIEEVFNYERDGVKCCRIASWNIHELSMEKITNPGVREVICRTILENKLSLISVQDVLEVDALRVICEELNCPTLKRVREWKSNSLAWEYCVPNQNKYPMLGFIYDSDVKGIRIEDIELQEVCLVTEANGVKELVNELIQLNTDRLVTASRAFLVCGRPIIMVNVHCTSQLDDEDVAKFKAITELVESSTMHLMLLGEFHDKRNVQLLSSCKAVTDASTALDTKTAGHSNILFTGRSERSFNGRCDVVRSGLSHLAIPRGWSWGGPVSPHCPIWAEVKIAD